MTLKLIPITELREADVVGVIADDGREYAIYQVEGKIFVTDNWCTHGQARLSEGFLIDHCIECPFHQGQFDVRTGQPLCEPVTEAIRCYPVRIEDGQIFINTSAISFQTR